MGFPSDSDSKESPAMRETWFQSLGWEDTLEEEMATHPSILVWKTPHGENSLAGYSPYSPWGHKELDTTERLILSLFYFILLYVILGK